MDTETKRAPMVTQNHSFRLPVIEIGYDNVLIIRVQGENEAIIRICHENNEPVIEIQQYTDKSPILTRRITFWDDATNKDFEKSEG